MLLKALLPLVLLLCLRLPAAPQPRVPAEGRAQGEARFAHRADLVLAAAASLDAADAHPLLPRLDALQRSTARVVWLQARLARALPGGSRSEEEALSRWPAEAFLAAARPEVARAARQAGGRLPAARRPESDGPPDDSAAQRPPMALLLAARERLDGRGLSPAQAGALGADLQLLVRIVEESEALWAEVEAALQALPRRRPPEGRWRLISPLPSENDVISHAVCLLEYRLDLPRDPVLPLGHPAVHLATCRLCGEDFGTAGQAWVRSLGVAPRDLLQTPRLVGRLPGRTRAGVVQLLGPPAEDLGGTWRYYRPDGEVTIRFGADGRVRR